MKEIIYKIRSMLLSDLGGAIELSNAEGWNQTGNDWKLFIQTPGNVCLVAETNNKIIGTTTVMNYSNNVAWIAMVLVDRQYRGRGVSKALLKNIIEKLQHCRCIKLDATPAGQQVYKKFGFVDEYRIARMTNLAINVKSLPDHDNLSPEPIGITDVPEVVAYDESVFGANRNALIQSLIKLHAGKSWMLKKGNMITGIALGRDGYKYNHVGPVFAPNMNDSKSLITEALKRLPNKPVVVDVLCEKKELVDWLQSIGFITQREFIRMYKNENLFPGMIEKEFLICGPEFG